MWSTIGKTWTTLATTIEQSLSTVRHNSVTYPELAGTVCKMIRNSLPRPPLCDILFKRSRKCYTTYVQRHAISEIHVTTKWRKVSNKYRRPAITTAVQSGHRTFQGRRQWTAHQCSVISTHMKNPWS
jgi:hypothetical protein